MRKDFWKYFFGFKAGDKVIILKTLKVLPFSEKGVVAEIVEKDKISPNKFVVKIEGYYLWLDHSLFEFVGNSNLGVKE